MTDLLITSVGDATIRSAKPSLPDGSGTWVRVKSGEMRGLLRPELDNIVGRTVTSESLFGRVGPGHVAQTYTVSPITERWSPGRVTWNNQPTVDSGAAITVAVGALPDGGLVEFPLAGMIQAVADGAAWYGVRISTNSTTTGQKFYATDSGEPAWELHITLSDAPDVPSDLRPDGGAVATGEPILAWSFVDLGGDSTEQAESWVQVDTPAAGLEPDEVSPDYDSGWQTNVEPEWDLAAVTYTPPVASVNPTCWRVNVRDGDGNESGWSDWAEFTEDPLPTLVVDSPTGAFGDPSPQLQAHLSSGTVDHWRAYVTGPDRSDIRATSGTETGPVDWQIPLRNDEGRRVLKVDAPGWINLKVWDDVDRAVAVGQKTYVETWIEADLTESGAVTPPTGLSVAQIADGDPRAEWSWHRTEAATGWLLEDGDETIARLDPEDVDATGGTYTWVDRGEIPPLRERTLKVRALEGNQKSAAAVITTTHDVIGVWLIPEDTDLEPVMLDGTAVSGFARVDRVATYTPLEGPEIDVIYDTPPRVGSFDGTIDSRQDVWEAARTINGLRRSSRRKARLVWGSQSSLVRLRDPDITSHDEITAKNLMHAVRFSFVERDD